MTISASARGSALSVHPDRKEPGFSKNVGTPGVRAKARALALALFYLTGQVSPTPTAPVSCRCPCDGRSGISLRAELGRLPRRERGIPPDPPDSLGRRRPPACGSRALRLYIKQQFPLWQKATSTVCFAAVRPQNGNCCPRVSAQDAHFTVDILNPGTANKSSGQTPDRGSSFSRRVHAKFTLFSPTIWRNLL